MHGGYVFLCGDSNSYQPLDGLGKLRPQDATAALEHEHYGVRVHGLRLAERWLETHENLLAQVCAMADDDDPSVRLQLAMSLGESSSDRAVDALLALAAAHGSERWMATAIRGARPWMSTLFC